MSETDISQLTVAIQKLKAIKEECDKLEPSGTVGHGMAHCEEEAKRLKVAVAKSLE